VTQRRAWTDPAAKQVTGDDGRFRFGNTSGTDLIFTAQAAGFVADDMTAHPNRPGEDVSFILKRGAVLRGRVLDAKGLPVPNASVFARGGDFDQNRFEWSTLTDAQGRFEWLSAPPSQNHYSINAPGYRSVNKLELAPDGAASIGEIVINARPRFFILQIGRTGLRREH
jgi:Carboxypeptidase regulatory-like domain